MLYLVVVAYGVTLHPALHLDGERQVSVDVVNQGLEGARHQPELLREVASKNARLKYKNCARPRRASEGRNWRSFYGSGQFLAVAGEVRSS